MKTTALETPAKAYVIGRRGFAAITAIEGLKLSSGGEERLKRTEVLTPAQRRAETIRAFSGSRKR